MRFLVIYKDCLDALPPLMNASLLLAQLGASVHVVCGGVSDAARAELENRGVTIGVPAVHSARRTLVGRARRWVEFHNQAALAIRDFGSGAILWIGSADTALALGPALLKYRYVLHLHELYDTHPHYRLMLSKFVAKAACVVVPEASRAGILRMWYGLPATPVVMPNKCVSHPGLRRLDISGIEGASPVETAGKLILYQGHIGRDRNVLPVAAAAREMDPEWRFAVMGTDWGGVAVLRSVCPGLIFIPHTPAPEHLRVTSHARIGVVSYAHTSLNNLFCAPNKIWEYAGFGIPMLCNDVPGLAHVAEHCAGLCADFSGPRSIIRAIDKIDRDYVTYSRNARRLFDGLDMHGIMQTIVDRATASEQAKQERVAAFFEC